LGAGPLQAAAAAAGLLAVGIPLTLVLARRAALADALRAAEARLQMALAAAPIALWSVDADGAFTSAEGTSLDALALTPGALAGQAADEVWRHRPELLHAMNRALAGETVTEEVATDRSAVRLTCAPLHRRNGALAGAVGAAVDLTERRSLEEQLRQAQKMEAIGRFTGGIAHDFNNVLTAILGYSDMTLAQISPDKPLWKDLKDIHQAATRAASLTRQLLAFSRKQQIKPGPVDVNGTVRNLEKMLRRLIGEDIFVELRLADDIGAINADTGQIEQILMNLSVNARDAMTSGGTLTIATSRLELAESYIADHPAVLPGPYVQITVTDTGCGMDARTKARLFEPFFTTKESGRGTGLGLATVYGIVKQFGGYIWVYSEPGLGSTFKLYFPEIDVAAAASRAAEAQQASAGGSENVLLVEDEDSVRAFTAAVLKRYGYHVLEASAPSEALLLAECVSGSIDLVLTDVIMPGMTGPDMVQRLRQRHPDATILYMSGYPSHVVREGILDANAPFLEKPFTSTSLLEYVRSALDRPEAGEPAAAAPRAGAGLCVWTE
ncbi:MAG: response regulator, partial [Acidobacteriota bacterium]|nr:response regulator [Acidobacteriota bacterium]